VLPPLHCPRCQAGQLLWGKAAWGCSNYRSCPLVIPFVLQGQRLSERDLRNLLERGETLPMMLSGPGGEIRAKLVLRTAGERSQSGTTSFVQVIAAPAPSR
jgi:DNA topoisomerase-3